MEDASAASGLRFHTTVGRPALRAVAAIARPMVPSPSTVSLGMIGAMVFPILFVATSGTAKRSAC